MSGGVSEVEKEGGKVGEWLCEREERKGGGEGESGSVYRANSMMKEEVCDWEVRGGGISE